jgi:hypothetical protein
MKALRFSILLLLISLPADAFSGVLIYTQGQERWSLRDPALCYVFIHGALSPDLANIRTLEDDIRTLLKGKSEIEGRQWKLGPNADETCRFAIADSYLLVPGSAYLAGPLQLKESKNAQITITSVNATESFNSIDPLLTSTLNRLPLEKRNIIVARIMGWRTLPEKDVVSLAALPAVKLPREFLSTESVVGEVLNVALHSLNLEHKVYEQLLPVLARLEKRSDAFSFLVDLLMATDNQGVRTVAAKFLPFEIRIRNAGPNVEVVDAKHTMLLSDLKLYDVDVSPGCSIHETQYSFMLDPEKGIALVDASVDLWRALEIRAVRKNLYCQPKERAIYAAEAIPIQDVPVATDAMVTDNCFRDTSCKIWFEHGSKACVVYASCDSDPKVSLIFRDYPSCSMSQASKGDRDYPYQKCGATADVQSCRANITDRTKWQVLRLASKDLLCHR